MVENREDASQRGSIAAVAKKPGTPGVPDGIAGLIPLVLALLPTPEAGKCLWAMVDAKAGVGEAASDAILKLDHLIGFTEGGVGVQSIVRLLVRHLLPLNA